MKKILILLLIITTTIFPATQKPDTRPDYRAYLVGDSNGKVYFSENMHTVLPLASVTKVMTMLLTFEALEKGEVNMNDDVPISANAARQGGSMIPVKVGETFKLRDLVIASAVHSANNATYAVAEHVGKGFENFIDMMNAKTRELGIDKEMQFYTPAGLPTRMTKRGMDEASAYAVYKLSLEAAKYPEYMKVAQLRNPKIANDIQLRSKNHLVGKEGIIGLKTGYHADSLYNISVISEENGVKTFVVVMGGKTNIIRDKKVLELLSTFRKNYTTKQILDKNKILSAVTVDRGMIKLAEVYPDKDLILVTKKDDEIKIEKKLPAKIKAPVKENTVIGTYAVLINGKEAATGNLIVKKSIARKSLFETLMDYL